MNRIARLAAYAAVGFVGSGLALAPASAAVVVDQSSLIDYLPRHSGTIWSAVGGAAANGEPHPTGLTQSITSGKTGYLDHIDLQIRQPFTSPPFEVTSGGLVILSLYEGDLAAGGATLLSTSAFEFSFLPMASDPITAVATFDVRDANFFVTPGKQFSVSLGYLAHENASWMPVLIGQITQDWTAQNPLAWNYNYYSGGELSYMLPSSSWTSLPYDIGFRSFVDETATAAVPEPASWAMMIGGFALAGGALRRRRAGAEVRFA
jgi:hypothetical protein